MCVCVLRQCPFHYCWFSQDLRNQLYESYYLNFISAISRSKLEDIASAALAANAVNQVTKVSPQQHRVHLRGTEYTCAIEDVDTRTLSTTATTLFKQSSIIM